MKHSDDDAPRQQAVRKQRKATSQPVRKSPLPRRSLADKLLHGSVGTQLVTVDLMFRHDGNQQGNRRNDNQAGGNGPRNAILCPADQHRLRKHISIEQSDDADDAGEKCHTQQVELSQLRASDDESQQHHRDRRQLSAVRDHRCLGGQ